MHPAALSEAEAWAPGAVLAGGWVVGERLGLGATAEIRAATGPTGPVALKVLREDLLAGPDAAALAMALRREGRKMSRLRHPALVRLLGEGEAAGRPYLVMERLHGADLRSAWPGRMPRGALARLLAGPAAALEHLHACGLVHGDVSPANLFREASGAVRLLDLGALRAAASSALDETGWRPPRGLPAATRNWAAPERLRGEPPDPRDDIHALARIASALLQGPLPRALRCALGPRAERPTAASALVRALRGPFGWLHG